MIIRALVLALSCAYAVAHAPLAAPADDDCALYLTGPGRSSAYDYSLNLLKGNYGYEGQHTCITYEAINQAYLDARNRILVSQPKGDWKAEDFASVGELVLDISINLARTYGLTYEEIEKGLPLIDTSRTLIREVCPPVFSHVECRAGKYRRFDGLCNNLRHPTWGATMAPFQRLIGPLFADGINAPRIAHNGRDLPLSRVVSRTMHPDEGFHDHAGTVMVIAWGQFMDHDYTLTGTPLDPINRNDPEECCKRPPHLKHPYCNEIRVPDDDYFYRLWGVKCIDFVRGFPSPRPGCRLGSRVPFNTLTGSIDGNTVYGVTEKFARKLRTGYGGLLRMNPVFKEYGLKDLLPLKLDIPDEGCTRPNKNMYCFEAGEIRVNEQLVLTVMHTLMAREHNRVAEGLAAVNPHWDDETLFQEARRINIAEIQHITYNEFLPILLGKDVMEKFGLVLEKEGYWNGYDPEVNPDVLASFAAAAYRFGHSLLPTAVERWSKAHKFIASKRLSDLIRRPYDLYRAGVLDEYVMGLMNQVAQAMDDSITQEVTNHLFKKIGARFGMDLVSFNMQRGREFGLPGYMEFRKFCGLPGAETFQDLFGSMANETVLKYETIFEHPIDVDLWSGGVSERPLPGSMLGPTFACIIATQFSYSRRGDRFWFELPNQPSSFTPEQLAEIRKSRLARVICDNTDIIDTVQLYPMVLPDHELNPRVPCRSGIIPSMDFSKWAEPVPFHGTAKQFMTDAIASNPKTVLCANNSKTSNATEENTQNGNFGLNNKCSTLNTIRLDNKIATNITSAVKVNSTSQSSNNIKIEDCLSEANMTSDQCKQHQIKRKLNENGDKILKYVYKSTDKVPLNNKSIGHAKNNLKRRKRSSEVDFVSDNKRVPPALIDYTTSHTNKEREELEPSQFNSNNVINKANLANFNIETLHDDSNTSTNNDTDKNFNKSNLDNFNSKHSQEETSNERQNHAKLNNVNIIESSENESREKEESNENIHKSNISRLPYFDPNENSNENDKEKNIKDEDKIEESNEAIDNKSDEIENDVKDISSNYDTKEKYEDSTDVKYQKDNSNENDKSVENSRESIRQAPKTKQIKDNYEETRTSHEVENHFDDKTQHARHKGKNIPKEALDSNRYANKLSPSAFSHPKIIDEKSIEQYSPFNLNEANQQPVNINDGEVKPVVELNNEDESRESNEEDSAEPQNGNSEKLDDRSNSSEEEPTNNKETNEKISALKEDEGEKVNVKQQFERIPLDYKHDDKTQQDTEKKDNSKKTVSNQDENINDGTLDTLAPKKHKYDDDLNIKFDNIAIKLPEIYLPEDILSYSRIGAPKKTKDKKKTKTFFYFGDEDSEEDVKEKKKTVTDADNTHDYYSRYNNGRDKKHENYKISKNQEDDDEDNDDPYEKFVRERFGKRGSFGKRSEKLESKRTKPSNPLLLETIENILKKTERIHNEAEKSGDPNAGYMWTLEYGENL